MFGVAERFDVVVTGVDDASHSAIHELASELTELTGMPSGDVQLALLQGELVVRRSVDSSQGQRALDELRGLGAKVTLRPVDSLAGLPFMEVTDSQALDLELEPDPDDITGDPAAESSAGLAPPPSFGELGSSVAPPTSVALDDGREPPRNRPGTVPPGARRHPSGSMPAMGPPHRHRHPTGPMHVMGPGHRHPTGPMPAMAMQPHPAAPMPAHPPRGMQPHPAVDYRLGTRPPTIPPGYPPGPGYPSGSEGPMPVRYAASPAAPAPAPVPAGSPAPDASASMASLARGLDLALVDLDEDSRADSPAVLEEVSSGDGESRRPAVVTRDEAATRAKSSEPAPAIDDPGAIDVGSDDGVLELDLAAAGIAKAPEPALAASAPASASLAGASASPVAVAPGASSGAMPTPASSLQAYGSESDEAAPRYVFGRDVVTSILAGLASALFVTMLLAFALSRSAFRDDITKLETELAESVTRPLDVQAQELRSAQAIRKELADVHASSKKRFMLIWLGVGLPLGVVLGRFRAG